MLINIAQNKVNDWLEIDTKKAAKDAGFITVTFHDDDFIRLLKPLPDGGLDPGKYEPIFVFQKI